jgi:hypothetical protein
MNYLLQFLYLQCLLTPAHCSENDPIAVVIKSKKRKEGDYFGMDGSIILKWVLNWKGVRE